LRAPLRCATSSPPQYAKNARLGDPEPCGGKEFGHNFTDSSAIYGQITSPTLLFWGLVSFAPVPENDPRVNAIQNCRLVKVPKAGHWVHHDQLELFLKETTGFLE
jgi:pimeloyl-ACP methyl ester carboxylesterase